MHSDKTTDPNAIKVGDFSAVLTLEAYQRNPKWVVRDPQGKELFTIVNYEYAPLFGDKGTFVVLSPPTTSHKYRVIALNADHLEFRFDGQLLLAMAIVEYRALGLGTDLAW